MPYSKGAGKVQKYIGRIVVVLTPAFVGLVAWGATQFEKLPGHPQLDQTETVALLVLAAGGAISAAVTWLVNLGKHERQTAAEAAENQRQAEWRQERESQIGEFGEMLGWSIEEAVPHLRAHLGLDEEIPSTELVLQEVRKLIAGVGAITERVDALELPDRAAVPN